MVHLHNGILHRRKKEVLPFTIQQKELLPFATAWMELETIMLSEISQLTKDKYHTTSPITGI